MIYHEWRFVRHLRIIVRFGNNPGRCVGHAEIEHLALNDEVVQAIHDFLHAGGIVPPMELQDIDVVCAELFQRRVDREG